MPLKQATSSEIIEMLVEKIINSYTAPKARITDQGPNFLSSVIRHIAYKYKISIYEAIHGILTSVKRINRVLPSCINEIPKTMVTKIRLEQICDETGTTAMFTKE